MPHGLSPPSINQPVGRCYLPSSRGLLEAMLKSLLPVISHPECFGSWLGKPSPVSLGNFFPLPCLGGLLSNWAVAMAG